MEKQEEAPKSEQKKESLTEKVNNSKVMIWITIIGTILGIVGFVLPYIFKPAELSVSLNYHNREMQVGQSDTLIPTVKPSEGAFEYIWKSDNETAAMVSTTGVVRLLAEGSATITLVVKDNKGESVQTSCLYIVHPEGYVAAVTETKAAEKTMAPKADKPSTLATATESAPTQDKPVAAKPKASSSGLNLGYATYDGDTRDGQPHGNGILTFSSSHLIPGTVDCTASAGEKVIGTFREGKVNMGTWYRNDGTQLMVKLGQKYNY